jgi:hypothetical protein
MVIPADFGLFFAKTPAALKRLPFHASVPDIPGYDPDDSAAALLDSDHPAAPL